MQILVIGGGAAGMFAAIAAPLTVALTAILQFLL